MKLKICYTVFYRRNDMDFYYEKRRLYKMLSVWAFIVSVVLFLPAAAVIGTKGAITSAAVLLLVFGLTFALSAAFFPSRLVRIDNRGLRIRRAMPLWWCDVIRARKTYLCGLKSYPVIVFDINPRAVYPLRLWKIYRLCRIPPFSVPLYALDLQDRKVLCGEIGKHCKTSGF